MLGRLKVGGCRANTGRAKRLCLFYDETFGKHPFLLDFKTSKLATDTHRHTQTTIIIFPADLAG